MITEAFIFSLLFDQHDYALVIQRLENLNRPKKFGLEQHHIEPDRKRIIWLKPLEHLAIHIAHAKLEDTNSNRAKVAAFIRPWPGSYRRLLPVSEGLKSKLISFGQGRPESSEQLNSHPNTIAARKTSTERKRKASAENGRKTADKVRQKLLGREILWADKISQKVKAKPMCSCLFCKKEMKAIPSNILQHQRSSKCSASTKRTRN
jgi:hypothetical protein